jgi:hypothetical protein
MSAAVHIAHFNWATLRAPMGDPLVEPFVSAVPKVNALAERSPGFIWRQGDEQEVAKAEGWLLFQENPRLIASFSVWETPEHLRDYVYKTVHGAFFKRADAWFEPDGLRGHILWHVPVGHVLTLAEARTRFEAFAETGPTEDTFTFSEAFPS